MRLAPILAFCRTTPGAKALWPQKRSLNGIAIVLSSNNAYIESFTIQGMVLSGTSPDGNWWRLWSSKIIPGFSGANSIRSSNRGQWIAHPLFKGLSEPLCKNRQTLREKCRG